MGALYTLKYWGGIYNMKRQNFGRWIVSLLLCVVGLAVVEVVVAQDAVVRALFFYSPTCGHCHEVMTNVFPSLREQYGDQLQILEVDIATPDGNDLYHQAQAVRPVLEERSGVPALVVGDYEMIGSVEIPEMFPGLIETYLAEGGVDWPAVPGIEAFTPSETPRVTWRDKFAQDPAGNTLSIIVLLGMLVSLWAVAGPRDWLRPLAERSDPWGVVGVALVGLAVALYLAYIELTSSAAVCVVGNCNSVHQSAFVKLFGILPVAVFGVSGYVLILALIAYAQVREDALPEKFPVVFFFVSLFGVLFSVYLTFLEPFVIGATCFWCLISAISMTVLLLQSAPPAWDVLKPKKRHLKRAKRRRF